MPAMDKDGCLLEPLPQSVTRECEHCGYTSITVLLIKGDLALCALCEEKL